MIDFDRVVEFLGSGLLLAIQMSVPVLIAVVVVGVITNLIQSIFQIQDQSLSIVPRLLAAAVIMGLVFPTLLDWIVNFTRESISSSTWFLSGG
ncbi:flagellar biosynthetic protein FliQ [Planctomycetota bacterium]|nr:flagellar biosynthetic protein FliQ [Planctomycetota bacterium]MDG2085314.1 flagellar biosynthetic protein FliQ [Planctomycetota bacterium]NCF99534.1 flagellar biosynthetic protein FliQ [Planctomycetia bacterium]NCG12523.1 flagellar biosynthetic protein FliQ [Planctomycetia bacterium]